MNKRKQVKLTLENLEQQFLMQQQQMDEHARYLSSWYAKNRLKLSLLIMTMSIGAIYLVQKVEKRPRFLKLWLNRGRSAALWFLDLFVFNPKILRSLVAYFFSGTHGVNTLQ